MDLPAAFEDFRSRPARASNRQQAIQRYCVAELAARGLVGAKTETPFRGQYRVKAWDVGLVVDGEPQLAISCKSIIANHGGTVPNRVDDMLGEAVSLHRAYPRAVLGYLFFMSRRDESAATNKQTERLGGLTLERRFKLRSDADAWFERLVASVTVAAGRGAVDDVPEKFEVVSCSQVDFDTKPFEVTTHSRTPDHAEFFDRLIAIYCQRFGDVMRATGG